MTTASPESGLDLVLAEPRNYVGVGDIRAVADKPTTLVENRGASGGGETS